MPVFRKSASRKTGTKPQSAQMAVNIHIKLTKPITSAAVV